MRIALSCGRRGRSRHRSTDHAVSWVRARGERREDETRRCALLHALSLPQPVEPMQRSSPGRSDLLSVCLYVRSTDRLIPPNRTPPPPPSSQPALPLHPVGSPYLPTTHPISSRLPAPRVKSPRTVTRSLPSRRKRRKNHPPHPPPCCLSHPAPQRPRATSEARKTSPHRSSRRKV